MKPAQALPQPPTQGMPTCATTSTREPGSAAELARLIHGHRAPQPTPSRASLPAQMYVGRMEPAAACALPASEAVQPYAVRLQDGSCLQASKAASCPLQPQAGDLVQLLVCQAQAWIVHVLERHDPLAPSVLELGAGTVQLQAGELHLQADTLRETALRKQSDIQGWSTTRAAFVDVHAERQLNLFGNTTTLLADALLKVDAAQIHMG